MVKLRRGDVVIFFLIALIGLGVFLFNSGLFGQEGEIVEVSKDGKVIARLKLSEDQIYTTPDGKNTIQIKDRVVSMVEAICPDQICVHTKPLVNSTGSIVCLPNRVSLRIIGSEEEEIDAITE